MKVEWLRHALQHVVANVLALFVVDGSLEVIQNDTEKLGEHRSVTY